MDRTPLETVKTWKQAILRALEDAQLEVKDIRNAKPEVLVQYIEAAEEAVQKAIDEMPCDGGIEEFVNTLGRGEDFLDDYYHMDQVMLTIDDMTDGWMLNERELARYDDLARHLHTMITDLPETHLVAALTDLIDDLNRGNTAWDENVEARVESGARLIRKANLMRQFVELSDTDAIEVISRAERGASFLDYHYPGWFTHVDPMRLELGSAERCVLGQLNRAEVVPSGDGDKISPYFDAVQYLTTTGWTDAPKDDVDRADWSERYGFNVVNLYRDHTDVTQYQWSSRVNYTIVFDALSEAWRQQMALRTGKVVVRV